MNETFCQQDRRLARFVGRRVRYSKPGHSSRNGWTGTLREVERVSGTVKAFVEWDPKPGETTTYSPLAFGYDMEGHGPLHPVDRDHDPYLFLARSDDDPHPFLVVGENGGNTQRVFGEEEAHDLARQRAAKSKSGQRYIVFRADTAYERAEPPVKSTKL